MADGKARVMIATPTMGTVKTLFMTTIMSNMAHLSRQGIDVAFQHEDGSDLAHQRNMLASAFLKDTAFTHLFFVDSDMAFAADVCSVLLSAGKPMIGVIATRRSLNFDILSKALKDGADPQSAHLLGYDWILGLPPGVKQIAINDYLLEVGSIGFGAVLIHRDVLASMIQKNAVRMHSHPSGARYYDFFFPRREDVQAAEYYSEDIAFCRRWRRDCSGRIWALTSVEIFHIGDFGFGGSFLKYVATVSQTRKS